MGGRDGDRHASSGLPRHRLWQPMGGDLVLIASREPRTIDIDQLRKTMEDGAYAPATRSVWRTSSAEGVLAHFIGGPRLSDMLVERGLGVVNTDDQNFLEFAFARSVGAKRSVDNDLITLSRRLGTDVPATTGKVDWARVAEERWLFQQADGRPLFPPPGKGPSIVPLITAFTDNHCDTVLSTWRALGRTDEPLRESAIVAECAARVGDTPDEPLIDRAPLPERAVLRAIWLARHGDRAAATTLLGVFETARRDPWFRPHLLEAAMSLAGEMALTDPTLAATFYDSLKQPFAVEAQRATRLMAAAQIAAMLPDTSLCVQALESLEPPPWTRAALELRIRCYRRAGHSRLAAAEADLVADGARDLSRRLDSDASAAGARRCRRCRRCALIARAKKGRSRYRHALWRLDREARVARVRPAARPVSPPELGAAHSQPSS